MQKNILHLASSSKARHILLQEANIPFTIIGQNADELLCNWALPADELVLEVTESKMEHAFLPQEAFVGEVLYVVTADTVIESVTGSIYGKPKDYDDAVAMVHDLSRGARVVTGFQCNRFFYSGTEWCVDEVKKQVVDASVQIALPDKWLKLYLKKHPEALQTAGVVFIEGYGAQFVRSLQGSYTAVLGLPMCELREVLDSFGFFNGLSV